MTTSADLLDLVHAALGGQSVTAPQAGVVFPTSAEDRIRRPGDLPTQEDQYPVIKLRLISETRQSLGRNTVQFTTVATIRVVGEVSAPADFDDPNVSAAEASLWMLKRQIEVAIINSYPLFRVVQQLASVQAQLAFTAQATHLAGIQADFAFEFYEGEEDFAPIAATDLDEVDAHLPAGGPGFNLHLQP